MPDTFNSQHQNPVLAPDPVRRVQRVPPVGAQDTLEHHSFVPRNSVAVDRGLWDHWEQLWGWGTHQDPLTHNLGDSMGL